MPPEFLTNDPPWRNFAGYGILKKKEKGHFPYEEIKMRQKTRPIVFSLSHARLEILRHLASSSGLSTDDYALLLVDRHLNRKLRKWEREHEVFGEALIGELLEETPINRSSGVPPSERPSDRKKKGHISFQEITRRSRPSVRLAAETKRARAGRSAR